MPQTYAKHIADNDSHASNLEPIEIIYRCMSQMGSDVLKVTLTQELTLTQNNTAPQNRVFQNSTVTLAQLEDPRVTLSQNNTVTLNNTVTVAQQTAVKVTLSLNLRLSDRILRRKVVRFPAHMRKPRHLHPNIPSQLPNPAH